MDEILERLLNNEENFKNYCLHLKDCKNKELSKTECKEYFEKNEEIIIRESNRIYDCTKKNITQRVYIPKIKPSEFRNCFLRLL